MSDYWNIARKAACAMITCAFAWLVWPSAGTLAEDNAAPAATATSSAPAEAANQSRRHRRRAAQTEPAAPSSATAAPIAAAAPAAGPATAAGGAGEGPETICKNIKPLGTRMAKRVCGTPEQWAALEKKTTDAGEENMRQIRTTSGVISAAPPPTSPP